MNSSKTKNMVDKLEELKGVLSELDECIVPDRLWEAKNKIRTLRSLVAAIENIYLQEEARRE